MENKVSIFWFRRDLRLEDNRGLFEALNSEFPVLPIFIFDTNILEELENKADARVQFIQQQLVRLQNQFRKRQKGMRVFHDTPIKAWQQIVKEYNLKSAFTNRDYEPYAQQRDKDISLRKNPSKSKIKNSSILLLWRVKCSELGRYSRGRATVRSSLSLLRD